MRMYGAMMNGNAIILPIFIHVYFLGYVKNNLSNRAIELFHQIKCGDPEYAEKLFSTMTKTVKSYGNLMNGFYENDNCIKVLDLYNQMKKISNQMKLSIYVF